MTTLGKAGFFPFFSNLAETSRLVRIAEALLDLGGDAVFFSHGGSYEYLAEEIDCAPVRVDPVYTEADVDELMAFDRLEKFGDPFQEDWLIEHVEHEERAYLENEVSLVVTGFNLPSILSARKAKVPLVWVVPGTTMPPYLEIGYGTLPDALENRFTKLLPGSVKSFFTNWYLLRTKQATAVINKVARRYGIPEFGRFLDTMVGDHTLISDLQEFLGVPETEAYPKESYTGPLLAHLKLPLSDRVRGHIARPGRSIFFSMGSSGNRELFLKALETLNHTDYNVVAVYTSILDEDQLPEVSDNVLLEKVVPAEMVTKMVDLSVLHGGQGTVYTAAYSGKPVVGIPMQIEQQYNLDILVRRGCAIRISKEHFSSQDLLRAISRVLKNYDAYLGSARRLAAELPKVDGARTAAERIRRIMEERAPAEP